MFAAHDRCLRIRQWIVARRRFRQASDHCQLREIQVGDRFAVVHLRGSTDTVSAVSEKYLVEIQVENFLLVELPLDQQCQKNFPELAHVGALARQKVIAGQLHGDRTATLPFFTGAHEDQGGT